MNVIKHGLIYMLGIAKARQETAEHREEESLAGQLAEKISHALRAIEAYQRAGEALRKYDERHDNDEQATEL